MVIVMLKGNIAIDNNTFFITGHSWSVVLGIIINLDQLLNLCMAIGGKQSYSFEKLSFTIKQDNVFLAAKIFDNAYRIPCFFFA